MIRIGSTPIEVPFVQAALSGYSDLPMRRLARRYGAVYTLNEVMLDKLVVQPGKHRKEMLALTADDHPVGGQLMGADPIVFAHAAFDLAQAGYDVIDINFGCPVKKVLGRCRGGFLLSEPRVAIEIVRRVFDAVGATHPVTVKMRRGMKDGAESERNFFAILDAALSIGVSAITIHGRTVEQRYVGPSRWEFLIRVKRHVGDTVMLGSGDLFTAQDCLRMMEATGVDGVTIARGCIGNPWIFGECRALQRGDDLPDPPTIAEQRTGIESHWRDALEVYGRSAAYKVMRKFGIKYSELHPHHLQVRDAFIRAQSADEFEGVLEQWYNPSVEWPPVRRRESPGDLIAAGATLCDIDGIEQDRLRAPVVVA